MAWWLYVTSIGYRPLTKAQWNALPVKGGVRADALRSEEAARAALFPPDGEE